MSNMLEHIAFERLADMAEGRLDAANTDAIRQHVAGCAECAASLAWLEHTFGLMRSDSGEDAPPALVASVRGLFRPTPPLVAGLRRLLAELRFDSATARPALGLRSGRYGERQLLFSLGEHDLDLRVAATGDQWSIQGQLLGPDTSGDVTLDGPGGAKVATLDDLCQFSLPPVAPGAYRLTLRLPDAEIEIPAIELER